MLTKGTKNTAENLNIIVERIEAKRKLHEMAAHIVMGIERIEAQQQAILTSAAKENKEVVESIQKGMKDNEEVMKSNLELLKQKIKL